MSDEKLLSHIRKSFYSEEPNFDAGEHVGILLSIIDKQAKELATLRSIMGDAIRTAKKNRDLLRALMKESIENCEICRGSIDCARCMTFSEAIGLGGEQVD